MNRKDRAAAPSFDAALAALAGSWPEGASREAEEVIVKLAKCSAIHITV
jgi:hypothetical protein